MLRSSGRAVWLSGSGETGWEIIEKEGGKGGLVRSLIPFNRHRQFPSAAITNIFILVSPAEQAKRYSRWLPNALDSISLLFYLPCHFTGSLFMLLSSTCLHPFVIVPSLPTCVAVLPSLNFTHILKQKFPVNCDSANRRFTRESVSRSQMDIKRKTRDIKNWEEYLFLDISSTYTDTFVPSLYPCVKTHSRQAFWVFSATFTPTFQTLRHQRNVCHQGGSLADHTDGSH
jgi:hypothetical protein